MIPDLDLLFTLLFRRENRNGRPDFPVIGGGFNMMQEGVTHFFLRPDVTSVDDIQRIPEQSADAAVAVSPSHFRPVRKLFLRMYIASGPINFTFNAIETVFHFLFLSQFLIACGNKRFRFVPKYFFSSNKLSLQIAFMLFIVSFLSRKTNDFSVSSWNIIKNTRVCGC